MIFYIERERFIVAEYVLFDGGRSHSERSRRRKCFKQQPTKGLPDGRKWWCKIIGDSENGTRAHDLHGFVAFRLKGGTDEEEEDKYGCTVWLSHMRACKATLGTFFADRNTWHTFSNPYADSRVGLLRLVITTDYLENDTNSEVLRYGPSTENRN